ncbi:unnamed protein product [Rhodiola kirilowii]
MASSINSGGSNSPTKGGACSPTPWTQVVAGYAEPQVDDAVDCSSDKTTMRSDEAAADGSYGAGDVNGGSKKPVWNKPSNGAVEIEPVMGADSWPALSEIAKGPQKSSGESSKSFSEASVLCLQGTEPAPPAQKQVASNQHPNSSQNHAYPARQLSFKRHGGNAPGSNGSSTQPLPPPTLGQSAPVLSNQNTSRSQKNINLESSQKVASESQSYGTTDRQQHSNSHRRINGPHHGDSSYSHRNGARKDQDRPNRDWNSQRSFNGRDVHPQATGASPRGLIRPITMPHGPGSYIAPPLSPTMRPFGPPVSYPDFPFYYVPVQPESIRSMGIPYPVPAPAPAPHHLFMQYLDPELYSKVIHQIDYYFSTENLIRDVFLRKNMDEQGWVPIKLIAGFKKVVTLTDNITFIMEAMRASTVVEVKDDKVRRRNDWMKWLMPESLRVPSMSTYLDPGSSSDVAAHIEKINIHGDSGDILRATMPAGYPASQHPSH